MLTMSGALHRLTTLQVQSKISKVVVGRHGDGGGLYLDIAEGGRCRWILRYSFGGRRRDMGLGSATDVTLAQARQKAAAARAELIAERDPLARNQGAMPVPTFGVFAEDVISSLEEGFKNEKHRAQWRSTLRVHAKLLAKKPVDQIAVADVLAVLKPIWLRIPETASRVRGRIEKILDAAKAAGHRSGENPAAWRGNLAHLLSPRKKLSRGHHAALPFDEMPALVKRLRATGGLGAIALEFTLLTACRSGEVRFATWDEFDLEARVWTIPPERTKTGIEHRVPLAERCIEIVRMMQAGMLDYRPLVFPGERSGKPLSDMTLSAVLRRLDLGQYTVHGTARSSFRDWVGERTSFPGELAEIALGHKVGNAVERAYRRGDALEKRRELMEAWARHCDPNKDGKVVPIRHKGKPASLAE
jgi:integrase